MATSGRSRLLAAFAALALFGASACGATQSGEEEANEGKTREGKKSGRIALLLPENKTARYEAADRPFFEQRMKELCPDCKIDYKNATQSADLQQQQADAALTNGADVLVLDPVDSEAAAKIVDKAKGQNVPVLSYERLILGSEPDWYISFDNVKVGEEQAKSLVARLDELGTRKKGQIVMINGSPTDNNAKLFKQGAHSVLDGKVKIGKEYDTPEWSPDNAQKQMDQAITALGKDKIVGVYAANDGTAGGAIAAMRKADMDLEQVPVTGQDAEVAGLQRVVAGEQYMTIYKPIKDEAAKAAEIAYDLLQGKTPKKEADTDNGEAKIPSTFLPVQAVTADDLEDTVLKDEWVTYEQLCAGKYEAACKKHGIEARD
ncbi:MAG: substrate-binding domain-containing protein [Streptosporangiales bacterium]|nr:substrate-binding domain-containing protein [Streptosporangiales bacterium]